MKRLNIMDLHRQMNKREERMTDCYQKALERCHKKIARCNEQKLQNCFFQVPEYMMGCPLYDLNKCMTYVMDELRANGFYIQYYFPNYIYISWSLEEIEQNKKKDADAASSATVPAIDFKYKPSGKLTVHL